MSKFRTVALAAIAAIVGLVGWSPNANALNFVGGSTYSISFSNINPALMPAGGTVGIETCITGGFCVLVTETPIGAIAAASIYNPWIAGFNAATGAIVDPVPTFNPFDPKGPSVLEAFVRSEAAGVPITSLMITNPVNLPELGTRINIHSFTESCPTCTALEQIVGWGVTGIFGVFDGNAAPGTLGNALDQWDSIANPAAPLTFIPHPGIIDNTGVPDFSLLDDGICNPTDVGCTSGVGPGLQTIGDITGDGTVDWVREVVLSATPHPFLFGSRAHDKDGVNIDIQWANSGTDGSARTFTGVMLALGVAGQQANITGVSAGLVIGVLPEPGTFLLLGTGLAALALVRRRS